jgi:trehalose/maltose transport system substrate-binding protein
MTSHRIRLSKLFLLLIGCLLITGCSESGINPQNTGATIIVFKHGKITGDPALFEKLIDRFEKENPGIKVKDEILPSSTDEQHQFYVINLEGKSPDFDVLSMDVIWVSEFARAGWLKDLSHLLPEGEINDFFPAAIEAVTYEGRVYAIPWYVDAGVLFYRKDLLMKYGFTPPETWQDLVKAAQFITAREPGIYGFIWQGKQYEGLICNALEYFRSDGGEILKNGKAVIDSPENIFALHFMRDLIVKYKVTPGFVTTAIEEPTRHIFGSGKALFMRNWPYAWNTFEKEGSPVRGKTGVVPLPSFPGGRSSPTLGGWQLGLNRYSKHAEAAEKLIRFLTSPESQKSLSLTVGYKPSRKSFYLDKELIKEQPFIGDLYSIFMDARPRPVSSYYIMMSQVMQPEFSAAISGIKTPEEALRSAQRQLENILMAEK